MSQCNAHGANALSMRTLHIESGPAQLQPGGQLAGQLAQALVAAVLSFREA